MDEENKAVSEQNPSGTQTPEQNVPQQPGKNMIVCKSCGAHIAKSAKTCPNCGAKNKKSGKKFLIFAAVAVVLIIIIAASGGKEEKTAPAAAPDQTAAATVSGENAVAEKTTAEKTTAAPEYQTVAIETLFAELENNAYNAQQKWKDQYVTITGGKVSTIDASGMYFGIESKSDEFFLQSVHVSIPRDIRDEVMSGISSDADVTVSGKISDVGELMGFTVDAYEVVY